MDLRPLVARSAAVRFIGRPSTYDWMTRRRLIVVVICGALFTHGVGFAAVRGALTGVVVAEREDADGDSELLLATPTIIDGRPVDEIRLVLPPKLAKKLTVTRLPPGWTMASRKGTVTFRGPPVPSENALAIALGADPTLLPDSVGLELLSGGEPLLAGDVAPQKLPRVAEAAPAGDAIAIPEVLTPGEPMTFTPIDPKLTPPGGDWVIGGENADWNLSFDRPEYTWTPPLDSAAWPETGLTLEYIDPWGRILVDGTAQPSLSDPADETSDEPRITGCSPKVLTGSVFCVCGTFPDEASRHGITLNGQDLGTPLSSSHHVLDFRLPEGLPPGPFTIAGAREADYDESDTATGAHIAVGGEIDRERLRSGESTPLRLWLEGTEEAVSLRLWNTTPAIVSLEGGEDQTVTTSGGSPNRMERTVHAVMPGDFVINYELEMGSCPCAESYEVRMASLITSVIQFASGEPDRLFWLRAPAPGVVELRSRQQLSVTVFDETGAPATGGDVNITQTESDPWSVTVIDFQQPHDLCYLDLERSGDLDEELDVLVMLEYDDPASLPLWEETPGDRFFSPYRRFPSGEETVDVLAPTSALSFEDKVKEDFGYSVAMGTTFLSYAATAGLLTMLCPAPNPPPIVEARDLNPPSNVTRQPMPPATLRRPPRIRMPSAPTGAKSDDNYCGVGAFIHSMLLTFPGALPKNVASYPERWDEVADNINQTNKFGTPAAQLVAGVNRNYFWKSKALNGKLYCAWELKNVTKANLSAWHQECDLKVLVYDVDAEKGLQKRGVGDEKERKKKRGVAWGHWLSIVEMDGPTFKVQDYDDDYRIRYINVPKPQLDFSFEEKDSTSRARFDDQDPIAGDGVGESIHFVAVCECDESWVYSTARPGSNKGEYFGGRFLVPPKGLMNRKGQPMLR